MQQQVCNLHLGRHGSHSAQVQVGKLLQSCTYNIMDNVETCELVLLTEGSYIEQ